MRASLLRGLLQTLGGAASVGVVSLLRNVLIARAMGAAAFGLWNLCLVAMRLATESHLGALAAVALETPRMRGAERPDEARDLERRAAAATLLFALGAGVASGVVLRLAGGPPLATAAILLAVSVVLQQLFIADVTIQRARRLFGGISVAQVLFAVAYLAGLLLLLPDFYVTGALFAGCVAYAIAVLALRRFSSEKLPLPSPAGLRRLAPLLRQGLPTYFVHLSFVVLLQVDRLVVWFLLGPQELGHYGTLLLGVAALLFVPDAFAGVLWPFAGERFGRSREQPAALRRMTDQSFRALAVVLAVLLPAVLGAMDVLVAIVLPHFAPALPALRPALAGTYLLALALPLRNVAMTVGSGNSLLRVQVAVLVLLAAGQSAAALAGAGLVGVALAGAAAWTLLLAGLLRLLVARGVVTGRAAAGCVALAVGLLALALGADAGLDAVLPSPGEPPGAWLRPLVPGVAAALTAALFARAARSAD